MDDKIESVVKLKEDFLMNGEELAHAIASTAVSNLTHRLKLIADALGSGDAHDNIFTD